MVYSLQAPPHVASAIIDPEIAEANADLQNAFLGYTHRNAGNARNAPTPSVTAHYDILQLAALSPCPQTFATTLDRR